MAAAATHDDRNGIRVAIVDDHRLVLDGLAARLHDPEGGMHVVATETTWAGLMGHPEFPVDVVVLDLHLEDGIPVGTKLRALGTIGTAAIVMSRHADSASITAAMRAGAMGFVPKTESASELIAAIRSAATSTQHLSEPLAQAIARFTATPDPGLGKQEQRALVLYASGRSIKEVAQEMATTEETVKSYIKRGRRKYREVGVDVGTRILLRRHGVREGWLTPE
ncbi:response regulator transcription factor [Galbitalea soli]|uniref:Response regulator transcription factor n=1 Tax=Galbitalea soli TaxID=1268042 RepID=A0A7C9TQR6_9MICO|nr:response regulator transcription factor [Galbitalea soli]NEM90503.1 response regulator transcription factor [Galbitalea soli]NYJ31216.1 DNA-binding NarL/FixJ family response regulator [Galbitalea soli]